MIPVIIMVPGMVLSVVPCMVFIPAALPFGAEVMPCSVGLGTVLAVALNLMIESGTRVFDAMLAPGAGIRVS